MLWQKNCQQVLQTLYFITVNCTANPAVDNSSNRKFEKNNTNNEYDKK